MKATWKDVVLAESTETILVEGNHYFPVNDVYKEFLINSETHTICPWKGIASYYSIKIEGEILKDAAWYYPKPNMKAKNIANHIAFWKDVSVHP
tara:strand:- start:977 stop:1258 length:282 start_codon:yes stop_codon:yes gene_type:complete